MTTREEVGRRIRQARDELGISQGELGQRMRRRRSHAAISDMERGVVRLDIEELAEVARLLEKDLAYFVDESVPAQSGASVVYRRGEYGQSADGRKATNRAIEDFKRFAREQVRRRAEGHQ